MSTVLYLVRNYFLYPRSLLNPFRRRGNIMRTSEQSLSTVMKYFIGAARDEGGSGQPADVLIFRAIEILVSVLY